MSCIFKIAALAVASLTLAPTVLAQARDASMRVAYGDLDMSTPAGGAKLLARIEAAAGRVCDRATPRSPLKPRAAATCQRETIEQAVRGVDIAALTLAWSGKHPATNIASR